MAKSVSGVIGGVGSIPVGNKTSNNYKLGKNGNITNKLNLKKKFKIKMKFLFYF